MNSEFCEIVTKFINNEINIDSLEKWYTSRLPDLLKDPNSLEADLIAEIELGIVEMASGRSSLLNIQEKLSEKLPYFCIHINNDFQHDFITTDTSNTIERIYQDNLNHERKNSESLLKNNLTPGIKIYSY